MSRKPNIILITCDTVRADRLGVLGYEKNITPFLDSLARRGIFFTRAFSVSTDTAQSFPAIMTSTYPLDYGGYAYIERPRVMVSEVLRDAGYRTMGFHSIAYLSAYFGYDKGWDEFHFLDQPDDKNMPSWMLQGTRWGNFLEKLYTVRKWIRENVRFVEATLLFVKRFVFFCYFFIHDIMKPPFYFYTAEETNEEIKKVLSQKQKQPLFLWVHYMDAHNPYGIFLKQKGGWGAARYFFVNHLLDFLNEYPRLNRIFTDLYSSLYDQTLQYIDDAMRDLFTHLRKIGVFGDEDIAIVTADHGEEFFEHGGFLHSPKLWNTHIHVPLIVTGPEKLMGKPRKLDVPCSTIDIASTIIDFAGARKPPSYRGGNLFDSADRPVFAETSSHSGMLSNVVLAARCVISDGYKLIDVKGKKMLFSLSDEKEEHNLYDKYNGVAKKLEGRLEDFKNR